MLLVAAGYFLLHACSARIHGCLAWGPPFVKRFLPSIAVLFFRPLPTRTLFFRGVGLKLFDVLNVQHQVRIPCYAWAHWSPFPLLGICLYNLLPFSDSSLRVQQILPNHVSYSSFLDVRCLCFGINEACPLLFLVEEHFELKAESDSLWLGSVRLD